MLGLVLVVMAAAGTCLTVAQPASAANFFTIRNFGSQLCIQTPPGRPNAGEQLVQELCSPTDPAQRWAPVALGGRDFQFVNQGNGLCMRVRRVNADFTPVETIDCTPISDSRWTFTAPIPNSVPNQIISRIAGGNRCLDISNSSKLPDAKVQIFHCTRDNAGQAFLIQ
jgi:hypothetical protein